MKIKKEIKIHMLPTEGEVKFGDLCTSARYGDKPLIFGQFENSYPEECKKQYLYFTSDEKPKEGNWCINPKGLPDIFGFDYRAVYTREEILKCRKIISTTDTKLAVSITRNKDGGKSIIYGLPKIPQSFVEEYAKQGGIDVVLVEYENNVIDSIFNKHINEYIKWKKTLDI